MESAILRRAARRFSTLAFSLAGALALSTSVGNAQSTIQLTNWVGTVYPAHAHLYTVYKKCSGQYWTVCEWYVRKLYGDNSAVVVVVHAPNGVDPACNSGTTQYIVSGYTRSACAVYVSSAQYGN
jgi:hypothetical protein